MDGKGLFVLHCLSAGCITGVGSPGRARGRLRVAGVSVETGTQTSKFVLESIHSLTA